jgi:hypothetical protein
MSKIILSDDGTLDTVLTCTECGDEFRFNYVSAYNDDPNAEDEDYTYDDFIDDCIADVTDEHDCNPEAK